MENSIDSFKKNFKESGKDFIHASGDKIELYLEKGDFDWLGKEWEEDRYVLIVKNELLKGEFDLLGEHVPLEEAFSIAFHEDTYFQNR